MKSRQHTTNSQRETEDLGRQLGLSLSIPALILLEGPLGAGKTALTRGIVEGLGCENRSDVHSPTFSLINEYPCRKAHVYHVDLYRLDSLKDLYSIGLDEILTYDAAVIIEWAEKLLFQVDATHTIKIEVIGEESRKITFEMPSVA
jgi:tRNA threonylcarbamoyladenosine biosynthesis protein TsaE